LGGTRGARRVEGLKENAAFKEVENKGSRTLKRGCVNNPHFEKGRGAIPNKQWVRVYPRRERSGRTVRVGNLNQQAGSSIQGEPRTVLGEKKTGKEKPQAHTKKRSRGGGKKKGASQAGQIHEMGQVKRGGLPEKFRGPGATQEE